MRCLRGFLVMQTEFPTSILGGARAACLDKRSLSSSCRTTTLALWYFKEDGKICVHVTDSRAEVASGGSGWCVEWP